MVKFQFLGNEVDFHSTKRIVSLGSLSARLNLPIKIVNQVHGDNIHILKSIDQETTNIDSDSIITDLSNVAIGVYTADCIPLLIHTSSVIAAVHLGRKGLLSNLAGKVVERFKSEFNANPEELVCHIGPHISFQNYIIPEDVAQSFDAKYLKYLPKNAKRIDNMQLFKAYTKSKNLSETQIQNL
jgi:polyphenol oxidase